MKQLADFIVKHSKSFVIVYAVLCMVSLVGIKFVGIEYDLSAYLPESMVSYQGKTLLEKEFEMGGMASIMIESTDAQRLMEVADAIGEVAGVAEVVYIPTRIEADASVMDIVFSRGGSTKETSVAIEEIENILNGETYYIGGESSIAKDMQDTTSREIVLYSLVAFVIIAIVLVLGSNTLIEPIYFFVAIGVAILINMGSNVIFGTISSNTNSVASILQLAVSMDYSIFLLHRYYEEKKWLAPKEAMAIAIRKTFGSVSASALTTVGGFLALVAMEYGIGRDMGFVLAKGVLFSLVCVLTLLPSLILLLDGKIKVKEHRVFIPSFARLADFFIKSRYVALVVAVMIAIPACFAHTKVSYYYSNEKTLKDNASSIIATQKIKDTFGLTNQNIVIVPLEEKDKLKDVMHAVKAVDGVADAFGLYSVVGDKIPIELMPKELVDKFQTENYTYFALNLDRPMEGIETSNTLDEVKEVLETKLNGQYFITGESVVYDDLKTVTSKDFSVVTWLSILIVGVILAITFKSVTLPIILLFIIQLGIWINLSIPYVMGHELNFISFIILGAIQLGATVDYAILFTERYKEHLGTKDKYRAMKETIADTSRAVITSALILVAGTLSVYFITTIRSAAELTMLIARGAIISLVLVYILLPAMLLVLDGAIRRTTFRWPTKK